MTAKRHRVRDAGGIVETDATAHDDDFDYLAPT